MIQHQAQDQRIPGGAGRREEENMIQEAHTVILHFKP